jgi:hypothetical protein
MARPALLFPILVLAWPAAADTVVVSIRTFIPSEHPSKSGYMLPVPGKSGKTMLPDAPLFAECFGTDNRSHSTDAEASVRFGGAVTIDPSAKTFKLNELTGKTTEYDCEDGTVVCEEIAGVGGFTITDFKVEGTTMLLSYMGNARNPCMTVAPAISFSGTVSIDTTARTVALEGKVDVFPSFEAVLTRADGTRVFLYKSDPANGAVPGDLVTSTGGGSRPVSSGVINY